MNWNYFLFHLVAQMVLMQLVMTAVSVLQKFVFLPLCAAVLDTFEPLYRLEQATMRAVLPTGFATDYALLSICIWIVITFGSTFLLHLPSMWERRVQMRRPERALDHVWYESLVRPYWHPPHIAFVFLWVPAKILRATATAIVWQRASFSPATIPTTLASLSIVLSDLWNQVFFIQHDLAGGLLIILLLLGVEFNYTAHLASVAPGADRLTIPGLLTCTFGATLNLTIWLLNRERNRSSDASRDEAKAL